MKVISKVKGWLSDKLTCMKQRIQRFTLKKKKAVLALPLLLPMSAQAGANADAANNAITAIQNEIVLIFPTLWALFVVVMTVYVMFSVVKRGIWSAAG